MKTILIIDDDAPTRWVLRNILETEGYQVFEAANGDAGFQELLSRDFSLVILDLMMPEISGVQTLQKIREIDIHMPVIIVTGYAEVQSAIDTTRLGAYDYLVKPLEKDSILLSIQRALEKRQLMREVLHWRSAVRTEIAPILSPVSPAMKKVMSKVQAVANTDYTILITGETGTGKDIIANAIHSMSKRSDKIFLPVDCGAIPENLAESELFGHEKGAFTGADNRKEGLFELAHEGTLFLDELGNLPYQLQAKLLRVIETRKIFRIGAKQHKNVDVRLIVATNLDMQKAVENGQIRQDLYYRLNEFQIKLPPLRERREDIVPLVDYYLQMANRETGKTVSFSKEAIERVKSYYWPGNIRELKNVVRAAVLHSENDILPEHLVIDDDEKASCLDGIDPGILLNQILKHNGSLKMCMREIEKIIIAEAVKQVNGDNKAAAELLGIHYTNLINKI
ncbi:sigma-54 dependent transcriptional regulator [bacterium]|nr:sigma-54 dependent transcriptional regulator [bacterium]